MKPSMALSTLKTAVGQFCGVLLGAVAVKLLAVLSGPAGVGLYSVLRHLQQMLSSVASIGGQNAVVQGLSSSEGESRRQFFLSSLYVFALGSLLLSVLILIFAEQIAGWFFAGEQVAAIRWLVIPIVLGALLFFFRGVLTAEMQFGALALVNMLTGLGAALVALPVGLAYARGYPDMLVLLLTGAVLPALIVSLVYVRRLGYLGSLVTLSVRGVTWPQTSRFLRVALPSLLSLFLTLGSILILRASIVHQFGLESAGQFDAAWSISAMYLALFLASLQSYLLPSLSKGSVKEGASSVLAKAFHFALLIALPLVVSLILAKPLVVHVLFSSEFSPSLDVLRWILIGDFVRVLGWIIATALVAQADMKGFAFAEGLWCVAFLLISVWLLPNGIEWIGLAYLVSYSLYLVFLIWRLRSAHGISLQAKELLHWLAGLTLVMMTAWICWNDKGAYSWHFALIIPAMLISLFIMHTDERRFARQLFIRALQRAERLLGRRPRSPEV